MSARCARSRRRRDGRPGRLERHLHVLARRQRVEQVVRLEDVADAPAHADERGLARAAELLAEHAEAPLLRRAERADEREERRLARARRAR